MNILNHLSDCFSIFRLLSRSRQSSSLYFNCLFNWRDEVMSFFETKTTTLTVQSFGPRTTRPGFVWACDVTPLLFVMGSSLTFDAHFEKNSQRTSFSLFDQNRLSSNLHRGNKHPGVWRNSCTHRRHAVSLSEQLRGRQQLRWIRLGQKREPVSLFFNFANHERQQNTRTFFVVFLTRHLAPLNSESHTS